MINSELPLKNKIIILTRSIEQVSKSASVLEKFGARVIQFPTIKIIPPKSWKGFDEAISKISNFDYLLFTSSNAVRMFIQRCEAIKAKVEFESVEVIAIGKKTADSCTKQNIHVHLTPTEFSSSGVIDVLSKLNIDGKKFFIPRSAIGRKEIQTELKKLGAIVKTADVYDVGIPDKAEIENPMEELSRQKPDVFIFTSPSTFENFIKIMNLKNSQKYFQGSIVAAIGPTTKSAIEKKDMKVDVIPEENTMDALVETVIKFIKKEKLS